MRSILVSIMLLIAIIVLYENAIGGEGSLRDLQLRGNQVNISIERIDP